MKKPDAELTTRILMSLVTTQVIAEAQMAAMGRQIRALAKEHGVNVPTAEEVEGL